MDSIKQKQQRPSVLRRVSQTAYRRQHGNCANEAISKEEVDADHTPQTSSPCTGSSLVQSHQFLPLRGDRPKQSSINTGVLDSVPEGTSALFGSGICRWPGCDAISEDFPSFLKHLHSEHNHGDKSLAQWRVQQDIVQYMESQLIMEKQKLMAMQLHLHLSEHKSSDAPQEAEGDNNTMKTWSIKRLEEWAQHSFTAGGSAHLLPDLVPGLDYYKYNNIRPPYTYAYLIRWSILESPNKQRTLNEIYNWFTSMFYFFRHNTATWKNAVRHNLSLHKCFVRVEGGKGAVWTVDETEYQRRKGQKYHRDCPIKWLPSY
ncbi:forkhead box protein P3 [Aulostomus maculatus]